MWIRREWFGSAKYDIRPDLITSAKGLSDADLDKKVKFFGNEMTVRQGLLVVLNHEHEHLGQSIAYARMNKIVPPWSK